MATFLHVAPPTYVTAPAFQPHRFGLFSTSTPVERPEPRWQNGIQFEPIAGGPASGVSGICFDPGEEPTGWPLSPATSGVSTVTGLPFAVYGWYDCSGMSRPLQEAEDRARAHLAAGEEREVERAIAEGDLDNGPTFAAPTDLGGPYPLEVAFGMLEGHLGETAGAVGVLHVPRSVVPYAGRMSLLSRQGQRLETELGNRVAAGAGYDAAGLGLSAAGLGPVTLHVTTVPQVRRSEVFVHPDPEFRPQRTNNDLTIYAWRVYLVSWEHVTAKVTATIPA